MTSKAPRFLSKFQTQSADSSFPVHSGGTTRALCCRCGNDDLLLEAAQSKEWRGVCTKQASITFVPPVYVSCPKCKRVTLLFDPLIHGCQAETKTARDDEGECKLVKCAITPGKVLVSYACQQNDNNHLSADTTENTEYYLNALSVFFGDISIIWQACNDAQK